jgi:hypothetical protein
MAKIQTCYQILLSVWTILLDIVGGNAKFAQSPPSPKWYHYLQSHKIKWWGGGAGSVQISKVLTCCPVQHEWRLQFFMQIFLKISVLKLSSYWDNIMNVQSHWQKVMLPRMLRSFNKLKLFLFLLCESYSYWPPIMQSC